MSSPAGPVPAAHLKAPAQTRFVGPGWRIGGAVAAWLLFMFCFTVLYQAAAILSGIGGYCASGGPYVIATQCPAVLDWAFPVGFIGGFVAWSIAVVFQRGFAAPLAVWAWPILFVGLGIEFFLSIPSSGLFVGILCGALFVIMGLAPLLWELRGGPRRIILGKANIAGAYFTEKKGARRTFYSLGEFDEGPRVAPNPGDWVLSLAVTVLSIAAGVVLGLLAIAPGVILGAVGL